jgi:ketosteroid isomerase-like protein
MDDSEVWIAKAAIAELITRYAALNDSGDWDALAALYTEEGRMNRPTAPDDFVVGRDEILAAFKARPRRDARHIVANVLVVLDDPTHARATSQILLYTAAPGRDGALPLQSTTPPLVGTYEDRLVRTGEGWRFVERRGKLDFQRPE